ncbi:hypothetical protein WJX73_010402 [Symbiochloris irregularis]|uniref:GH16 domain-containing protein n=1 Tax=Symbiochloris irregularis TaxID=706552 RepID=A0AAW1NTJ0_9CHLO
MGVQSDPEQGGYLSGTPQGGAAVRGSAFVGGLGRKLSNSKDGSRYNSADATALLGTNRMPQASAPPLPYGLAPVSAPRQGAAALDFEVGQTPRMASRCCACLPSRRWKLGVVLLAVLLLAAIGIIIWRVLPKSKARSSDTNETFANSITYSFENGQIPSTLQISNYAVPGSGHAFLPSNVAVVAGYLQLTVPGAQLPGNITGGEVSTAIQNILHGSVTVSAILSAPAGTCNGFFFYGSDSDETDIEWLSDPLSLSNNGAAQIHYTNQDTNGDSHSPTFAGSPPSDATSVEHDYQIVWQQNSTTFYIDGQKQGSLTSFVPTKACPFVINNWSNADPGWSAGPPLTDSVLKIRKIVLNYDTA